MKDDLDPNAFSEHVSNKHIFKSLSWNQFNQAIATIMGNKSIFHLFDSLLSE